MCTPQRRLKVFLQNFYILKCFFKGAKPFTDSNLEDFFITTEIATDIWVIFTLEAAFRKVLGTASGFLIAFFYGKKKKEKERKKHPNTMQINESIRSQCSLVI